MNVGIRLVGLIAVLSLTGCFDSDLFYRYSEAPENTPVGADFYDVINGPTVGGFIDVEPAVDEQNISSYVARWGIDGEVAPTDTGLFEDDSNYIGEVNKNRSRLKIIMPAFTEVPEGVNSIVVRSKNSLGETETGASVEIFNLNADEGVPSEQIPIDNRSPRFYDTLNNTLISGSLIFDGVPDEAAAGVTKYVVRFAGTNGCQLIGMEPLKLWDTQEDVSFDFVTADGSSYYQVRIKGTVVPKEAHSIIVVTANDIGEGTVNRCNYPRTLNVYDDDNGEPYYDPWNKTSGYGTYPYYPPKLLSYEDSDDSYKVSANIRFASAEREESVFYYAVCLTNNAASNKNNTVHCNKELQRITLGINQEEYEIDIDLEDEDIRDYDYLAMISAGDVDGIGSGVTFPISVLPDWFVIQNKNEPEKCVEVAEDQEQEEGEDASYTYLKMANCDASETKQRFTLVSNPVDGKDYYRVHAVSNNKCIYRSGAIGNDNFKLTNQCWYNSQAVRMEITPMPNSTDDNALKIARLASSPGMVDAWSCMSSNENDNGIQSLWHNCNFDGGITWYFLKGGSPLHKLAEKYDGQQQKNVLEVEEISE